MGRITLETAGRLVAKGLSMAAVDYGRPICIAVVDGHGDLIAFGRQENAPVRSIAISQGKAYTAARMGVNTDAFLERLHREQVLAGDFCDPKFTSLPGGAVLKSDTGAVIGAVGISGLKVEEDQAIANMLASLAASGSA
ncbi:heme-binding protein [Xanthobacteraceae bacterium Astr-EGSB]|uniref:GlcG/HbpS family heme-binding protein n=1 Tax=Astrobacterium formosum TaxID=3069710 RepID=UPI0027B6E3FA|nr:heme-binding protein [Xanthobacteraceae bacterium Astr-EGSB]